MPRGRGDDHHALTAHEVLLVLETDATDGLSQEEARSRRERFGPNRLPAAASGGWLLRVARQFHNPLVYVLLVAGVVTLVLGEVVESVVIFGVVLVNALVGYLQEAKAEAALDALRDLVRTTARVVRGGRILALDSEDLVPGDLVRIEAGDKVPADLRLTRETDVEADESALTGESVPVVKDELTLRADTVVADRRNMLYSGTLVTRGSGTGVVVATGAATEMGQIHRLVGAVDPLATPLTRRLAEFSRILTGIILGLAAVTFLIGIARGEPWPDMFTAAVALAVGAIPEGLPAAVTITLAIGVGRMARRRAVVRRLPAVETLGSTTIICTDKTGTLTKNEMTVVEVWTAAGTHQVKGVGYSADGQLLDPEGHAPDPDTTGALGALLDVGVLCNDANVREAEGTQHVVGDPTEAALVVLAEKAGRHPARVRSHWRRLEEVPFSSEEQCMRVRCGDGDRDRVLVKGAVERVLELCTQQRGADGTPRPLDRDRVLQMADDMAARGLRVLAAAEGIADPEGRPLSEVADLELVGLFAMQDPPRPAAAAAVAACRRAGITVKMITGDHAGTATAVAEAVGLLGTEDTATVLTGSELARLPDAELADRVDSAKVFARVSPEQKLRLVEALQAHHHVVAMTGDGVNDAPALRQADIGVAMGQGGTEVAKEASDMVLTDDDFATIEAAVEEGRGVFDNLTKFIVWTLPTNMAEGMVVLTAIVFGATLPILPVQILWINMTTAVALGLMLAFEPKEAGIMTRPPRDPHAPLLSRALVERILLVSAVLVGGSWWVFHWELGDGSSVEVARTAALNLFVVVEAFYLINCRSLTSSIWAIGWLSNRWVIAGLAVQAVGQLALTYVPVMQTLFDTAPLDVTAWLRILAIGLLSWVVVTVDKRMRRNRF
jgi:cation-transporting ATPase F